jgi:hypothetical protein
MLSLISGLWGMVEYQRYDDDNCCAWCGLGYGDHEDGCRFVENRKRVADVLDGSSFAGPEN